MPLSYPTVLVWKWILCINVYIKMPFCKIKVNEKMKLKGKKILNSKLLK